MTESSNSGHLSQPSRGAPRAGADHASSEKVSGPVPMHHRLKLGQDVLKDAQGAGAPSTRSTIANGGRNGW